MATRGEIFTRLPRTKLGSNYFDLSHSVKTSFAVGWLTPFLTEEVYPGDVVKVKSVESLIRFAPLLAPIFERMDVTIDFFFIPNRIMWPDWDDWISGKIDVEPPHFRLGGLALETPDCGTIGDYLGYAADTENLGSYWEEQKVSAFPLKAYLDVYDDWYRSDQIQEPSWEDPLIEGDNDQAVIKEQGSGSNLFTPQLFASQGAPFRRSWAHDYFNSCLYYPQTGMDGVEIPTPMQGPSGAALFEPVPGDSVTAGQSANVYSGGAGQYALGTGLTGRLDVVRGTISDLRAALGVQSFLEALNRGGRRFREYVWSIFGEDTGDARVDRPEFIFRHVQNVKISEVLSQAETLQDASTVSTPVGGYAGHAISAGGSRGFNYRVREHGWFMGIINVQPKPSYFNTGMRRHFQRFNYLDYFTPQLAHIGDQAVRTGEMNIFDAPPDTVFGYQSRWAELKFINDHVHGAFGQTGTYDFWHMAQLPVPILNSEFLMCDPRLEAFVAQQEPVEQVFAHIYNNMGAIRKMPKFAIPGI